MLRTAGGMRVMLGSRLVAMGRATSFQPTCSSALANASKRTGTTAGKRGFSTAGRQVLIKEKVQVDVRRGAKNMQEELLRGDIFTHAQPMARDFISAIKDKPLATIIWEKGSVAAVNMSKLVFNKVSSFATAVWKWALAVAKDPSKAREGLSSTWASIKSVAHHTWISTKLLAADVRVASKILNRRLQGRELSRREHKMLVRTGNDLLRLIPFSFFIIIPAMELALPLALKLFPNMLPSTFQDKLEQEEKQKKLLRLRVDVAQFFQDVLDERAKVIMKKDDAIAQDAEAFSVFLKDVRSGKMVTNEDVMKFARLFKDEITLDNLPRPQLVAMCRYMNLNIFGTDSVLRYRLRSHLRELRDDDKTIVWEGSDKLTDSEVAQACRARGIRVLDVPTQQQRRLLNDWLELSMNKDMPSSLMILSRAFVMESVTAEMAGVSMDEALSAALSSMPEEVVDEIKVEEQVSTKDEQLRAIKRQEQIIESERSSAQEKIDDMTKEREEEEVAAEASISSDADAQKKVFGTAEEMSMSAAAERASESSAQQTGADKLAELHEKINVTAAELRALTQALEVMSASSAVEKERKDVEELHQESDISASMVDAMGLSTTLDVQRMRSLVKKLEEEIDVVDSKIGEAMHFSDMDNDGVVTVDELRSAVSNLKDAPKPETLEAAIEKLDLDKDGMVSKAEISAFMENLKAQSIEEEGLDLEVEDEPTKKPVTA